jgi:hypothetical protein
MKIANFADALSELDRLCHEAPTTHNVRRFVELSNDNALRQYGLENLAKSEWLRPLAEQGFFSNPPAVFVYRPEPDKEREVVAFPLWPQSRCLARLAATDPNTVLDVILSVPETDNSRITEDFVKAALFMSGEQAAQLVPLAKRCCESVYGTVLPQTFGKMLAHLAREGQHDAAIDLAVSVLRIVPDPRAKEKAEASDYRLPPEPRFGAVNWAIEDIIRDNIPDFVMSVGVPAFALLCNLLNTAILYSQREPIPDDGTDYSYIWLEDLRSQDGQIAGGLKNVLGQAVRDNAQRLIDGRLVEVDDIIDEYDKWNWRFFTRLTLYVLAANPDLPSTRAIEKMVHTAYLEVFDCRKEYGFLLQRRFKELAPSQQEFVLKQIDAGPDTSNWEQIRTIQFNAPPTPEERQRAIRHWQGQWIRWIKDSLSEEQEARYRSLMDEDRAYQASETSISFEETFPETKSPKTLDQLKEMDPKEVLEFVCSWRPEDTDGQPTKRWQIGLSDQLARLVEDAPSEFAQQATALINAEAIYVRCFLSGLRNSLRQQWGFSWEPVLELCSWMVSVPYDLPSVASYETHDTVEIGYARQAVLELIDAGLQDTNHGIPYGLRKNVWLAIEPLTRDGDPTPEYEATSQRSDRDPVTWSLNTTRGKAMHAVIRYALWVDSHPEQSRGIQQNMPEVREVLKEHLDTTIDPSLTVRAVYGQWFPWLVKLDRNWARQHVSTIFPRSPEQIAWWQAAWNAYIVYCNAFSPVYDVLAEEYLEAVRRIITYIDDQVEPSSPESDRSLAGHLMAYYWYGKISLDDEVITEFFDTAPASLRGYALGVIGSHLDDNPQQPDADVISRLSRLWDWRWSVIERVSDYSAYRAELAVFGSWFASGKFDMEWSMRHLLASLRLLSQTGFNMARLPSDSAIVTRLCQVVQQIPTEAIQALSLVIGFDEQGWHIETWRDEARSVIAEARKHQEAQQEAIALANRLIAMGFYDFRDLARTSQE